MADRSPLLNQLDKNSRTVLEDIYNKVEQINKRSKRAVQPPVKAPSPAIQELQSAPNVRTINTITVSSGTDRIDITELNTQLTTLSEEMEIMRQGLNSALIAIRQISGQ